MAVSRVKVSTWKVRLTAAVVALVALLGVGTVGASTAEAAKKVCTYSPPGSVCGNDAGPYWN